MAQKLKFGNGTWATKKGSTLAYNDERGNFKPLPFTTTRDSIATRVNKEGLIEVVGNNKPRIDYKDSAEGVFLLEKASTNLLTHSSELTNSSWVKTNTGTGSAPSITSNYSISPDGTQNADRVIFNLNGGTANGDISQVSVTIGSVSSASYTNSVYIKSNTANNYDLVVTDPSGGHIVKNISTEWQRFDNPRENVTNASFRIRLRGDEGTSDYADVSIWGAQLEQQSFVTSLINTSGSTVQRAAETASGAGNSEVFNDSEGVLFAEINLIYNQSGRYITLGDGTSSNRIILGTEGGDDRIIFYVIVGGNVQCQIPYILPDINAIYKIAIKYKQNDFALWVNGLEVGTDTSGSTLASNALSKLVFNGGTGTSNFYGKTKELGYYNTALTDAELEYMTSYRSLNELVTELNLNEL